MFPVGAVNKSNQYELPKYADKNQQYTCPECHTDVILKRGTIRIPHFAHKADTNTNRSCKHYDAPSESDIHKAAKEMIKKRLETEQLIIRRKCVSCDTNRKVKIREFKPKLHKVEIEHRFKHNGSTRIADVAFLHTKKKKPIAYIEIFHTHRTDEAARPEPWYEFKASNVMDPDEDLMCVRHFRCTECNWKMEAEKAEKLIESWIEIPEGCIYSQDRIFKETYVYKDKPLLKAFVEHSKIEPTYYYDGWSNDQCIFCKKLCAGEELKSYDKYFVAQGWFENDCSNIQTVSLCSSCGWSFDDISGQYYIFFKDKGCFYVDCCHLAND